MASDETLARLVRSAVVADHGPGRIMAEGERPAQVGIILCGTFAATWGSPDGRVVYAGLYGPPQFVGLGTLAGGPMAVGIEALTSVSLATWPSALFRTIADADRGLSRDLLDRSAFWIQALNHLNKLRAFTSATARLAGLLLQHEAHFFGGAPPVARRHLAAMAGVTPQMATRIVRRWEARAVLRRVGASGLELLDREALEAEAAPLADFPSPGAG